MDRPSAFEKTQGEKDPRNLGASGPSLSWAERPGRGGAHQQPESYRLDVSQEETQDFSPHSQLHGVTHPRGNGYHPEGTEPPLHPDGEEEDPRRSGIRSPGDASCPSGSQKRGERLLGHPGRLDRSTGAPHPGEEPPGTAHQPDEPGREQSYHSGGAHRKPRAGPPGDSSQQGSLPSSQSNEKSSSRRNTNQSHKNTNQSHGRPDTLERLQRSSTRRAQHPGEQQPRSDVLSLPRSMDLPSEHVSGVSQLFAPSLSPSVAPSSISRGSEGRRGTKLHRDRSRIESPSQHLFRTYSGFISRTSQTSSKVSPHAPSSIEMDYWFEDEQIKKHKVTRAKRVHRKHEKLSHLVKRKVCVFVRWIRERLRTLVETLAFEAFIFVIICLNTIMLVAQTFAEVEIRGDFFIMIMAVLDCLFMEFNTSVNNFYSYNTVRILKVFKSLRALRAIRVLRRLSILTSMQEVAGTLAPSLPSIMAILILMFTCLFLFSVVLRALFRHSDPVRFHNILTTLFTLFTMLTLDDWSFIYLDSQAQGAWYIIPILMVYIIIQYFIFLNLVIAVLVDNFQMALIKGLEKTKLERDARDHEKLLEESGTDLGKEGTGCPDPWPIYRPEQKELLFHYLQLVAGVEHHQQKFRSQASIMDEIVDTTFETGEEDSKK
ncbi:cation channel sperm-associated protein 1 [Echinops telfairi]|uniref:Cation channel sperm-associated protein 1 n=1 Tax=Echinops telfairi TaxID=9371 RepID=A0ABM0ZT26_ECHTE|nr:cation channel sperm-associated protein 1 [Echinops telfairi]